MTSTVNESYRLNVNVQESGSGESGVLIYAWNVQATNIVNQTTDVNGDIPEQNVEVSEFNDTGTGPVETVRTPIRLRAMKFGFFYDEQELNISADTAATFFFETNTVLTELVQATIDAYTGITYDDVTNDSITMDGTGITPVNTTARLYDYTHSRYSKAATPPQYPWFEVIGSSDGQNYLYDYTIIANAVSFTFDGQGANFTRTNVSASFLCSGGATFTDITVDFLTVDSGSVDGVTHTDVNVTDTVFFDANGTVTWDGGAINNADLSGTATAVTLILLNGASVSGTVDPGITIQNNVGITLTITDESDNSPLPQARGYLEAVNPGPLAPGTVILPATDADGSGVISGTVSIPSDQAFTGLIAEQQAPGLYVPKPITGTISAATGLTQTISLVRDE